MGFQLVGAALQPQWAKRLSPRDQLVLVAMCHQALDESSGGLPPRTFWGGTSLLMLTTLGQELKAGDVGYNAAREGIRRSLRRLEEVGAIKRVRSAVNGMRSEYELTVWAPQLPVDNSTPEHAEDPEQGHATVALRATPQWPLEPPHSGPQGHPTVAQ